MAPRQGRRVVDKRIFVELRERERETVGLSNGEIKNKVYTELVYTTQVRTLETINLLPSKTNHPQNRLRATTITAT